MFGSRFMFQVFLVFLLVLEVSAAAEMSELQTKCALMGFKKGTPNNGNCVLELMRDEKERVAQEQEKNAMLMSQQAELERLRQQQAQMLELQRQAVMAQQQAAEAQQQQVDAYRFNNSMQMLLGTGAYARPQQRAPITCNTFGTITTCN